MPRLDWRSIDRFLMGEAWADSRIPALRDALCIDIGPRWASSDAEHRAARMIRDSMSANGLAHARLEEVNLATWRHGRAEAEIVGESRQLNILPFNRCPPVDIESRVVDVGFGTERETSAAASALEGAIAVMMLAYEPFTEPEPHTSRLKRLAALGAAACLVVEVKSGGRIEYRSASDWRSEGMNEHPIPTVGITREDGALLRTKAARGCTLRLFVDAEFYDAPAFNTSAELAGGSWPNEHILLGGHHDTVYGAPGGNDNASGTVAVMETARVLAALQRELGIAPGRTIRFVTFTGEEQKLQGSAAYVASHYGEDGRSGPDAPPRFALNLDELSTGAMKGIVLMQPHFRGFMQRQLDSMHDGLRCHVQQQLDANSDHYPFVLAGLQAGICWRWRFASRHADSEFHHEPGDTADKMNVPELKVYVGQLARLLLRLSHVPPVDWPDNPVTAAEVREQAALEAGTHVRVFHG